MTTTSVLAGGVSRMGAFAIIQAVVEGRRVGGAHRALAAVAMAAMVVASAGTARAHNDPAGCFQTGPAIVVSVFRADMSTGVVGTVSECETIFYQARLAKAQDSDTICAFAEGTFKLTTPDGVEHVISTDVPCIGGTAGEGCDATVDDLTSSLIQYTVNTADIVGGFVVAHGEYAGGITHDVVGNTAGASATTPKSTPVVLCNDNDNCTIDVCDPAEIGSAACSNTAVVCNDNNACTGDVCNPADGQCVFTPNVVCDDNSLCTTDVCDTATGQCVFTPSVTCNDNDACTADVCDPATGNCVFTPNVTCNDNNACTADACDPATGNCVFTPNVTCTDNDLCTADACDPATGNCVFTPNVTCNDNDACTADACDPATGNCVFTPNVTCNDNNACTADACDPATGSCVFTPNVTCTDNNLCTADVCDPATGNCVFTPNVTCTDNNLCTADACDPATGNCVFTPNVTCTDDNLCTADACDPATGNCTFTPTVTCNDNSVCTTDACNPATGQCVFTPSVTCNDNNVCTDDRCDPVQGCVFADNSARCDDGDICTIDSCDPVEGCLHEPSTAPECQGLNHFQCYEIKPFNFARRSVSVEDRYTDLTGFIRSPDRLCAPSDKRSEDPTAPADPEHLISYPNPTSPIRILNQTVTNQFGTVKLDLVRRKFLLVPASKSLQGPPPPLANPVTDHFQCYQVRRSAGAPRFVKIPGVATVDQFGSQAIDILRPRHLCVPANKNDENPGALSHTQNLLCYKARHRTRFPTLSPFTNDQFGALQETITRRMEFCVPSTLTD